MKTHVAAALLLASVPAAAWAQAFQPARPVKIVVHNAPGGGSDVLARYLNVLLDKEKLLPVRTQVLNRPGGGGATAMAYVAEKRGDPHTIALYTSAWMLTPILAEEAKVTIWEMTPIARLVLESALVLVKADSPYRTEDVFARMVKTREWRKYLEDNLFEDGFLRGEEVVKANKEYTEQMRGMLKEAGLKVYR